jgi:exo-beta-1,3-glucanase (GH17 family)
MKELNVKPTTLKQVLKRIGKTLERIVIGNNLLNRTQIASQLRERIDKRDYTKLKSFCTAKERVTRLTDWEKILPKI